MKAITVKQPWAELIARGEKLIENRTQAFRYRGPLAIHAGQSVDGPALRNPDVRRALGSDTPSYAMGGVIAVAELVDCHVAVRDRSCCSSPWAQFHTPGAQPVIHLVLADVRRLAQPVAARGFLGLWEWTPPLSAAGQPP